MNTTFDKNRFMLLLKWETMTSKKKYIRQAVTIAILFAFLFCCQLLSVMKISLNVFNDSAQAWNDYKATNVHFIILITSVYMTFIAASIFRNMSTKQQRITYMMQPASNLEKFIVRFLHVTIGYGICFVVALAAADLLQFLLSMAVLRGEGGSLIFATLDELYQSLIFSWDANTDYYPLLGNMGWLNMSIMFTLFMLNHSFWILCGTLFRRNPLFFTLCTQFVLTMMIMSVSMTFFYDFFYALKHMMTENMRLVFFFIGSWAIIGLMYYGAYRLFCRMQVVNNKWINV